MSSQQPYPRQPQEGIPDPSRRTRILKLTAIAAAVLAGMGAVVGLFFALLWAFNPVGDEWHCSDGEAPAGPAGDYDRCYETDKPLPRGFEWDPWGNRPIASNCDKEGWVQIERIPRGRGPAWAEEDCVREGTELPGRWRTVDVD